MSYSSSRTGRLYIAGMWTWLISQPYFNSLVSPRSWTYNHPQFVSFWRIPLLLTRTVGPLVRSIAATIGLARESHLSKAGQSQRSSNNAEKSQIDDDQAVSKARDSVGQDAKDDQMIDAGAEELDVPVYGSWELDEAHDEIVKSETKPRSKVITTSVVPQSEIPNLAEKFAATYPLDSSSELPRLCCSVILPQRRPDTRRRGFIRAYSPVLAAKDIDEECFLDFIDTFNVASQANPLLYTINLAAFSANALPLGIGVAVAEAVRLAVDVSVEMQSRYRTNDFLRKINKLWFLPRGLICFPMIWKPSVSSLVTNVAIDDTVAEEMSAQGQEYSATSSFKASAGATRGNVRFPDAAPLTFPVLDDLAESTDEQAQSMKKRLASSMKFTNDYLDRRAQATYAMNNPQSGLSHLGVRPDFQSRYSDPNHPAASGSLLGLITGGAVSTGRRRRFWRQNQKGVVPDGSGAAVADFLHDIRLRNVVRTLRGKVGNFFRSC